MDKNSFLKIPNEFVWNKDKGYEGTLLKEIGEKVKKGDILAAIYTNKNIKLSNEDINCFIIE